ncbi:MULTISPECIES: DUF6153 family protein [unclassified Streptomyces]|uniref:DUF6153 family protein n=1 Tax=unclassified Streptomyces TaxID=2593676 RepID=UPI003684EABD
MRGGRARHGRRAGGALAHLLLVGLLALGVFMMHSTGHPEGPRTGTDPGATAAHSPGAATAHHGAATVLHTADAVGGLHPGAPDAGHGPGSGMDMTTLCVAVLAGWLLAGLVRAALRRRTDWLHLLHARRAPAPGPHAPPRRPPDLAELSVLRI